MHISCTILCLLNCRFGTETDHLVLNELGGDLTLEAVYEAQAKLNLLHDNIFPLLPLQQQDNPPQVSDSRTFVDNLAWCDFVVLNWTIHFSYQHSALSYMHSSQATLTTTIQSCMSLIPVTCWLQAVLYSAVCRKTLCTGLLCIFTACSLPVYKVHMISTTRMLERCHLPVNCIGTPAQQQGNVVVPQTCTLCYAYTATVPRWLRSWIFT